MTATLHDALDDLASAVRTVDLAPRVTAGLRRRRQRRTAALAAASVVLVTAGSLAVFRPDRDRTGIVTPVSPSPSVSATALPVAREPLYDVLWQAMPNGPIGPLRGRRADGTTDDLGASSTPLNGNADLSPDGRLLAYPDYAGLTIRDLESGTTTSYPSIPITADDAGELTSEGPKGTGWGPVAWAPDNRTLAVSDTRRQIGSGAVSRAFFLVDTTTGHYTRVAYDHRDTFAWSPDGTLLAVSAANGGIDVITRTGERLRHLDTGDEWVTLTSRHAWSPDGAHLLVQVGDEPATTYTAVVSATTGAQTGRLPIHYGYVWLDATHVACQCSGGSVTERALSGGTRTLLRLPALPGGSYRVAIRPAS